MSTKLFSIIFLILLSCNLFALEKNISWPAITQAKEYLVRVCSDKLCKFKVLEQKIKEPVFKRDYQAGKYYFQMAVVSRTGLKGFWSKPVEFIILPGQPELIYPEDGKSIDVEDNEPVNYEWEKVPGALSYTLEVVDSKGKLYTYTTKKLSQSHSKLMVGETKWRVKASLSTGESGEFSQYRPLTMYKEPPRLVTFNHGDTMELYSTSETIDWEGDNFSKYKVTVGYAKTDLASYNPLFSKTQKGTSAEIKYAVVGMYKVTLEGLYKGFWVQAKPVEFEFKDPGAADHIIRFAGMAGSPKTNLTTSTAPQYAVNDDDTADNIIYANLHYEYNWSNKIIGFDLKKGVLSTTHKHSIDKVYYGYKFGLKKIHGFFRMGLFSYSLDKINKDQPSNFRIEDHFMYYLGVGAAVRLKKPVDFRLTINYDQIAPIRPNSIRETITGAQWDFIYEHFVSKTFAGLIGVYRSSLNDTIHGETHSVDATKYSQTLLGVKLGFSINF